MRRVDLDMVLKSASYRTWMQSLPARVTQFLMLSFLSLSCVSLVVRQTFVAARPAGPANPAAFLYRLLIPAGSSAGDSWNPMIMALHLLQQPGQCRLYETLFFGLKIKFQYPPSSMLPLLALNAVTTVTPRLLNAINSFVVVTMFAGLVVIALDLERVSTGRTARRLDFGHLMAAAVPVSVGIGTFYPVLRALQLGQIQIWIDGLFVWACVGFMTDRKRVAGALIGLACLLKPQMGLFLIWGFAWREYRMCFGLLLAVIPLEAATVVLFGLHNNIEYLNVLSFISHHGEAFYANQSLNGLVNRLLSNGNNLIWQAHSFAPFNTIVYLATSASGAVFAAVPICSAFFLRRQATAMDLALAAVCFTMASPVAWEHHYGVALPLFMLCLNSSLHNQSSSSRRRRLMTLGAAWCLISSFMPWLNVTASTWANILQSYTFLGGLLLVCVASLEVIGCERREVVRPDLIGC